MTARALPINTAASKMTRAQSWGGLGTLIFVLANVIGVAAFAAPFFAPALAQNTADMAASSPSPLLLSGVLVLSLAVLILEAQNRVLNAKLIALLGVLVAINAALRFAENVLPGPGGFTPVFMLIILTGAVFGGRVGFLMGALSMLVSAFVTGGVGPWLPYQMFTAGWMGLSAGIFDGRFVLVAEPKNETRKTKIALLAFSGAWGFLYGAIMNLWSWPYQAGDAAQSWHAGLSAIDGLRRYAVFYAATSLWWDVFAAVGNVALVALLGLPTLKALSRFKRKFLFEADAHEARDAHEVG